MMSTAARKWEVALVGLAIRNMNQLLRDSLLGRNRAQGLSMNGKRHTPERVITKLHETEKKLQTEALIGQVRQKPANDQATPKRRAASCSLSQISNH